jgi:hypothetical protein
MRCLVRAYLPLHPVLHRHSEESMEGHDPLVKSVGYIPVGLVRKVQLSSGQVHIKRSPMPAATTNAPGQYVTCSKEVTWVAAYATNIAGRGTIMLDPHYIRTVGLNTCVTIVTNRLVGTKNMHEMSTRRSLFCDYTFHLHAFDPGCIAFNLISVFFSIASHRLLQLNCQDGENKP